MNMTMPLPAGEVLDPLSLVDPTLADRPFRRRHRPGLLPGLAQVEARPLPMDIPLAGVGDLLAAYRHGAVTPIDVLARLRDSISKSAVGAQAVLRFVADLDVAMQESARRWMDGTARPLEGVPFGVKDIIDVAGTVTTSGSWFTGDRMASADAAIVGRLRAAGAIPFAMLATTEFASGSPHNPRYGTVTNPWDVSRWTGGSSTGSGAALAARLMPFALGTDTGGSIRVPSCWCGTTGLKPSRELVSREGVAPLSWTLDHIGPMTRSASDIARVLPFMVAEPDSSLIADCEMALSASTLAGLRVAVPVNWFTEVVDSTVLDNWLASVDVLRSLGCVVTPLPVLDIAPFHADGWTVLLSELATHQSERLDRAHLFDRGLLARLEQGAAISAADYGRALQRRKAAQDMLLSALDDIDLIVTPGIGGEAGFLDTLTVDVDGQAHAFSEIISRNTMIFDYTGFPALMLPSGHGRSGLPTGMQIVGRPGADALCLKAGVAFQASTAHHLNTPTGIPA
ncbi:aspartyl-tRNA(Asn)/glutamyl-tRNA(Gln) amidotransferase subunit A [Agrobacterium larrymoorei]|uniref:Aspartyl-tRNA(Asn)/glutamyl-tRNA(Gln) amidotransferase subunit A n=1 Tax=Agrobacterium larrymoorei TaxID=160699 RepID=A0AAJ2BJ02_9HYPH|nr:amidase [Agrobacterium larrymoorei]MDR6100535.1 aspartyl-tRNA(Asn)/glutamyl-tRNA(Gln) amidotransferase subunit A [Agrobacterium larrymoorei]